MHKNLSLNRRYNVIGIALLAVSLAGCSSVRKASDSMGKWRSDPLMPSTSAPVDLISALSDGEKSLLVDGKPMSDAEFDVALAKQLVKFNDGPNAAARRNLLQDRLKLSSDQLCDEYKSDIMRKQARANFWLGTTSLLLGTAGAAVTSVNLARGLAGGAAFSTGVRSEYNQDFFLDQTITVINKAIKKRQAEIEALYSPKRKSSIADYSVLEAVNDVSNYHGACSLAGALDLADKAIGSYDVTQSIRDAAKAADVYQTLESKLRSAPTKVEDSAPARPDKAASEPGK